MGELEDAIYKVCSLGPVISLARTAGMSLDLPGSFETPSLKDGSVVTDLIPSTSSGVNTEGSR